MSALSLWRRHILPFLALVGLLAAATLAGDYLLHRAGLVWVGRYLGIPGTLLILASLTYSLRKRKHISWGEPRRLLGFHEFSAWLGSLLVLLHAGIHFSAILPWLATVAMGIDTRASKPGGGLFRLPCAVPWRAGAALHRLPQAGADRPADHHRPAHRHAAHLGAVSSEARRPGLPRLPQ